jgi:hypothetical protein
MCADPSLEFGDCARTLIRSNELEDAILNRIT